MAATTTTRKRRALPEEWRSTPKLIEEEEEDVDGEDDDNNNNDDDTGKDTTATSTSKATSSSSSSSSSKNGRKRARRQFSHIKSDILASKTLVRRAHEERNLRASRSTAGKWKALLDCVCGGAGTFGTLASMGMLAKRATGASTAFVAFTALASFSYVWRGAVRRRGEEAERRLCLLQALEDDPGRIARLLDLLDADPMGFMQDAEALSLLERPRGELVLFREEHLVVEALLGKVSAMTAFLRQPHLQAITSRLRRDYPLLAEGMDRALLLELGDDYSPRALTLKDLAEILTTWQWEVLISDRPPLRRQLEESFCKALHAPQGKGPKGDLGEALLLIDASMDARAVGLLKARLPRAYSAYTRGETLLRQALAGWEGSLSSFLLAYPRSTLVRRLKPTFSSSSSSSSADSILIPTKNSPSSALLDSLHRLWQREVQQALASMEAKGGRALDALLDGPAWAFISEHQPALDFLLLASSSHPSSSTLLLLPPPAFFYSLASRRAALVCAASNDKEKAEAAAAQRMREESVKMAKEMEGLKEQLAQATAEETLALEPLLAEKQRVWATINGGSSSSSSTTRTTTLKEKMEALDEARARISNVQEAATEKRHLIKMKMDEAQLRGEKALRIARKMGMAKAAVSEAMLQGGKDALARELLREVAAEAGGDK